MRARHIAAIATGLLFVAAGVTHFARPEMYRKIVPPQFGHAAELVAVSGRGAPQVSR